MQIFFPRKQVNQFVARQCRESFFLLSIAVSSSVEILKKVKVTNHLIVAEKKNPLRANTTTLNFAQVERNIN